ncbi:hypothetical protein L1887_27610 [Cichorium endivia]|nr:hypothetical protein L1887_27610 [Cichorium endivia]
MMQLLPVISETTIPYRCSWSPIPTTTIPKVERVPEGSLHAPPLTSSVPSRVWIRSEYWEKMIDEVWNTDKWKRKSESGKQNRNKMEHGSISKHCCGSIPISHHRDLLESKLKRPPTCLELFDKTHRTKKAQEGTSSTDYVTPKATTIVDAYKDGMVTRYSDDIDSHPPYDHQLWLEATGGIKKGRVLGFGSLSDPHNFLVPTQAAPSTTQDNVEVIVDRIREEMKEELKAEREEIEAQKQEIAKMYHEFLKFAQGNNLPT